MAHSLDITLPRPVHAASAIIPFLNGGQDRAALLVTAKNKTPDIDSRQTHEKGLIKI